MHSPTNSTLTKIAESINTSRKKRAEAETCSNPQLTCVDLFAGAGGFSLAAKMAGIHIEAAVEMNQRACDTYRANLIDTADSTKKRPQLYEANILDLSPEDLKQAHFPEGKTCDLVLGGPPCQGFSVHRIGDSGVGDPRNALILRYFEFVRTLMPKAFLMENVPGMLWPRHKNFLDEFFRQSNEAGYRIIGPLRLDARDYGVPQRRVRVFFLGIREDVPFNDAVWPPKRTHGDAATIAEDPTLLPWLTAQEVFAKPIASGDENNVHMNHSEALIDVFRSTPINGGSRKDSNRVLPCHEKHQGHSDVYGRINPSEPGPTMTTACINPSKGRFVHPTEHHGITARHAARFQTFPDDYIFKGGLMAAGIQVGNAVPVKLGEVLIRAISKGLAMPGDM